MAIKILSTSNLSTQQGVKCLGYGKSGIGKTRLGATAPRPIFLSAEKGLLSLKKEKLPYIEIFSMKELEEAHLWAMKSAESRNFDTYCLDSVTEIAEVVLDTERQKQKDPRKLYPEYQSQMMSIFRDFRDMPQKHVYFIAKESIIPSIDNSMRVQPSFPGNKLPEAAPYFFDQVFRIEGGIDPATGQPWQGLKCRADQYCEAKDRSGALSLWEPPDLTAMFRKIMAC